MLIKSLKHKAHFMTFSIMLELLTRREHYRMYTIKTAYTYNKPLYMHKSTFTALVLLKFVKALPGLQILRRALA